MAPQNAKVNISAEFIRETKNPETEVSTFWFKAQVAGRQWPDLYIGMSKRGDVMECSVPYFNVDTPVRNQILSTVRNLQSRMK